MSDVGTPIFIKMNFQKKILFIILIFFSEKYLTQINLVPNYSFENYNTCPLGMSSNIYYANLWQNANVSGTSDYYSTCVPTLTTFGFLYNCFASHSDKT